MKTRKTTSEPLPDAGSVTIVECTCGQLNAWQNTRRNGTLSRSGEMLVNLFKVMHESHGGTVTVRSQNDEMTSPREPTIDTPKNEH